MTLTSGEAANVRGIARRGSRGCLKSAPFTGVSLAGIFELACSWHLEDPASVARESLEDFGKRFPSFAHCLRQIDLATSGHSIFSPQVIDGSATQIYGLRKDDDYTGKAWATFMLAFRRQLTDAGFDRGFAYALSQVFTEFAQNVPDHSAADSSRQSIALVGFQIRDGEVDFGVADVGRGMLESLQSSPRWAKLKTSSEAVRAVIYDHATRKFEHAEGGGFKETLQAFVDHNCELRLSTGSANSVVGQVDGKRQLRTTAVSDLPGVRVVATCFLRQHPLEKCL